MNKYLIIGGSGTLGQETAKQLLERNKEDLVYIFSRDELKQKKMREKFKSDRLEFIIGDIRDKESLSRAFGRVMPDIAFHYAALKHIDILEKNPEESVITNILGTINFADVCEDYSTSKCVFSSTDKAVHPVNAYGMSKGISEKILLNRNKHERTARFFVFRWGNILGSNGSVIHDFYRKMKEDRPIYITDKDMTRFWLMIDDAVKFILNTIELDINSTFINIPKVKSASVLDLAIAIGDLVGKAPHEIEYYITGNRGGEKLHERLEEDGQDSLECERYKKSELRAMAIQALNL